MQPVWHLRICQTLIILLFNQLTEGYSWKLCDPDTMGVPFFRRDQRRCQHIDTLVTKLLHADDRCGSKNYKKIKRPY